MNILTDSINFLDETSRLAYLQAMGITSWVPKDFIDVNPNNALKANQRPQPVIDQQAIIETVNHQVDKSGHIKKQPLVTQSKISKSRKYLDNNVEQDKQNATTNFDTDRLVVETEGTPSLYFNANQYLKLIKWSNQTLKEEGTKKLLILCRHQTDQPANSFARSNSPSQFMLDYINTLSTLLESQPFELKIQMANLSEAGLGEDCVNMNAVLQNLQPDLILALGDETVSQLSGNQSQVALHRGRLIQLGDSYDSLVSYHPYSLIENPSLKSLAYEDLYQLAQHLSSVS